NPGQQLGWYVKQRGIGKHAIEIFRRQIELEEILTPNFTTAVVLSQLDKALGAVQANGLMTQVAEDRQVAPRSAPEIEDAKWAWTRKAAQQGISILADVVIARTLPKALGVIVIMRQCNRRGLREFSVAELAAGVVHC